MYNVQKYLEKLELTELEAKLYLALLESGPITVRDLARKTGIGRTTSYPYIDLLMDKGLIMKIVKGVHILVSVTPLEESLHQIIEKKAKKVNSIQNEFPEIIQTIKTFLPVGNDIEDAEITYYRGKQGVKKIYDDALSGKELHLYVNLRELARLILPNNLGLDVDLFERSLKKNKDLKIFEIISDTPASVDDFTLDETSHDGRYLYKYMPTSVGLTAPGILLYDNKVAIINGGAKLTCIVLHNPVYYINTKKIFDYVWSTL